jgi:WD40 repeat protein
MVQEISCVKFQSDGDLLYVGLDDGTLKIMDM